MGFSALGSLFLDSLNSFAINFFQGEMVRKLFLVLPLLFFFSACSRSEQEPAKLEVLRVGVLPDESIESLKKRHQSLLDYLAMQLGIPVELVIPEDYKDLIDLIGNSNIDIGYFGGVTFVQASEKHGVIPIVMRDIDKNFSSYFLSRDNSDGNKVEDFRNSTLSFGNQLSTSGHFMPLHFLKERGIYPLEFFSKVMFSGSHENSVYNLRDGKADLVAVNSRIVRSMIKDGRVSENEIHLIWETPAYSDYVWAIRKELGNDLKDKITNAFLSLTLAEPSHVKILENQHAEGFLPASKLDFIDLGNIMKESL